MIIRKSDGGYNYSTTDLATVRYRVDKVNCDRAIYVVGSDQALHFRMVFAVAREAGWLPDSDDFEHAQIGMVQGKDGHRLRTRAGDTGQAQRPAHRGRRAGPRDPRRGRAGRRGPRPRRDRGGRRHRRDQVRRPVDRAGQRVHLRLGPDDLLQGEHRPLPPVRDDPDQVDLPPGRAWTRRTLHGPILVTEPAERELARKLLEFGAVVTQVADTAEPHRLCAYLFEVASLFTTFYEQCPVLKADDDETRRSRLALCAAVLRVLTTGLGLLGVPLPDRM